MGQVLAATNTPLVMNTDATGNDAQMNNLTITMRNSCIRCKRTFKTSKGLLIHLKACKRKEVSLVDNSPTQTPKEETLFKFKWNEVEGEKVSKDLDMIYNEIVFWKKNLFILPSGNAGKSYIRELTRLVNAWNNSSPLRSIAMKAIHVMPALLLQKPSKKSKAKDHQLALEKRLKMWHEGNFLELYTECLTIQSRMTNAYAKRDISAISKKFKLFMQKGDVNSAMRLLSNSMQNGILPLNDETLMLLEQKHPNAQEVCGDDEILLNFPLQRIHPIAYDVIDEDLVLDVAAHTKGGSGPSGLDGDGWRRILCSSSFGTTNSDLRKAIVDMIKKLCTEKITDSEGGGDCLEAFVACRMIPLNKNPGLRPIGVGEVLRRIAGKVVMRVAKKDIMESTGSLQVCAGQDAGAEAAIHAMHDIYENEETEAVLLIDAENAFNSINRKAMLHNIAVLCPLISTFMENCYNVPARLFVIGGKELSSKEGTTQGDPTSMAAYAIGVSPLLRILLDFMNTSGNNTAKHVAFADDFTVAGKLSEIKSYWEKLTSIGPKFGYFPKADKSYLIVKARYIESANEIFKEMHVKITSSGQRHLGAVIGDINYKNQYVNSKIQDLMNQLQLLSQIAVMEPQSAFTAFNAGFKSKFTYLMRTIPNISKNLQPIEDIIRNEFLPAITGGHCCSNAERDLLSLPIRLGGLGITNFVNESDFEYDNSRSITASLSKAIYEQVDKSICEIEKRHLKNQIKDSRNKRHEDRLTDVKKNLDEKQLRLNDICSEKGCSNWLTVLPYAEHGFDLNKQQFWDGIKLRYNWPVEGLPTHCVCGSTFDIQHCLSCKKGGFVTLRHNNIRDITASMLGEVCKDVAIEPSLIGLTGETFDLESVKKGDDVRTDVRARGFWTKGQQAFFDVRVFDPNASRHLQHTLQQCYAKNEAEKKRQYNTRINKVDNGTFTPLVFSLYGGMGRECATFYKRLSEMIAEKRKINISVASSWIRTKICFALIHACLLCLRGSRGIYKRIEMGDDIVLSELSSCIK